MTTSRPLPEPDAEPEQPRLLSRPSRLRPAVWRILGAVVGAVILGGAAVSIPYPAALASLAISLFLSGALLTKRGLLRPRRARNFSAAPRWVLIAGATALGLTFVQVLRFPADLTPGDGLLIAVTVFIGAESPRLLASAARRIPAWFWTAAILISASALLTLLRPETGVQASLVPAAKTIAAMVLVPLIVVAIGSPHVARADLRCVDSTAVGPLAQRFTVRRRRLRPTSVRPFEPSEPPGHRLSACAPCLYCVGC